MTRNRYSAVICKKKFVTADVLQLTLELESVAGFQFKPGQFVSCEVAPGVFRAYSIISDPRLAIAIDSRQSPIIELLIKVGFDGIGARFFETSPLGNKVKLIGPAGRFILPDILPDSLLFLATGVGIAPFVSMLHYLVSIAYTGDIKLLWGLRYDHDVFLLDFLAKCKRGLSGFDYEISLSQPSIYWNGAKGRITEHVQDCISSMSAQISERLGIPAGVTQIPKYSKMSQMTDKPSIGQPYAYICGNNTMVDDCIHILKEHDMSDSNLVFERFSSGIA